MSIPYSKYVSLTCVDGNRLYYGHEENEFIDFYAQIESVFIDSADGTPRVYVGGKLFRVTFNETGDFPIAQEMRKLF